MRHTKNKTTPKPKQEKPKIFLHTLQECKNQKEKKIKQTQQELGTITSGAVFLLFGFHFNNIIMTNYLLGIKKLDLNHILNNTYFLCLIIFSLLKYN